MPDYTDRTPLFRVRLKGPGAAKATSANLNDIDGPGRLQAWTFTEVEKGASKGQLTLNNFDLRFPDDPMFDRGVSLYVSWGYAGDMTEEREMIVADWTPGPKFIVDVLDRGSTLNKLPVDETYDGLTYSGIARKIAERNGYTADQMDFDESGVIVESVPQNNRTDWQLLAALANEMRWVFGVTSRGIFFHARRLGQAPAVAISYYQGVDSGIRMLAFPTFEKPPAAQPGAVTVKGIDPKTKKPFEVKADDTSTAGRPGLATQLEVWGKADGVETLREKAGAEIVVSTTAATAAEAKTKADGLFKSSTGNPVKCSVPITGEAKLKNKSTVELKGIGRRLSGVYYVAEIAHTVSPGIFTQVLKCRRDGTNGLGGAVPAPTSAAKPNDQKGPVKPDAKPVLVESWNKATGAETSSGSSAADLTGFFN